MGLFGIVRRRPEPSEAGLLAADLYAGGDDGDLALAYLIEKRSATFRAGGDYAVELLSEWMDILTEGNPETAKRFCAIVLPMLPAETRRKVSGRQGNEDDPEAGEGDPLIQSLTTKLVVGGREGAAAATQLFNAVEKVKGFEGARVFLETLFSKARPEARASMIPYLSERLRALIR